MPGERDCGVPQTTFDARVVHRAPIAANPVLWRLVLWSGRLPLSRLHAARDGRQRRPLQTAGFSGCSWCAPLCLRSAVPPPPLPAALCCWALQVRGPPVSFGIIKPSSSQSSIVFLGSTVLEGLSSWLRSTTAPAHTESGGPAAGCPAACRCRRRCAAAGRRPRQRRHPPAARHVTDDPAEEGRPERAAGGRWHVGGGTWVLAGGARQWQQQGSGSSRAAAWGASMSLGMGVAQRSCIKGWTKVWLAWVPGTRFWPC